MKVAVLGYGSQGISSVEYWQAKGDEVTVCDSSEDVKVPHGVDVKLGKSYLKNLNRFDLIIRSPSIHPRQIIQSNPDADAILNKVTTNTNEFIRVCPTNNIIGVTGTKGKGTTSTLIAAMLEASGKKVHLCGNIGTPPLDIYKNGIKPDDWIIMELANFQLIDLKQSPLIAVCLMVEPEHLDWHKNLDEYLEAKQQLFRWQSINNQAIFYSKNILSYQIAQAGKAEKIPYMEKPGAIVKHNRIMIDKETICELSEINLLGDHNWQNICAAVTAVWQIEKNKQAIRNAIRGIKGLPFRIELRRTFNKVKFYNDSFSTAPGATMAAISAVKGKKVVIIGGHDRHLDLDNLSKHIKDSRDQIEKIVIIGQSGERMADSLKSKGFDNYALLKTKDMDDIVNISKAYASPGTAVILSPGFASFGMFKNFEERGKAFNKAVDRL